MNGPPLAPEGVNQADSRTNRLSGADGKDTRFGIVFAEHVMVKPGHKSGCFRLYG